MADKNAEPLLPVELGPAKVKFAQGPYPQIWGIDSPRRAMLIGQLCHIFDLARFFGGDVETVSAIEKQLGIYDLSQFTAK